jgi:hypothetical protein
MSSYVELRKDRKSSAFALILEGQFDLRSIGFDLAVIYVHVELRNFGDAQVSQGFGRAVHGSLGCLFPRLGAGAYELDDLVNAVSHRFLLFPVERSSGPA